MISNYFKHIFFAKHVLLSTFFSLIVLSCSAQKNVLSTANKWTGLGYQKDLKDAWKMEVTKKNATTYFVKYPDQPCSGEWIIIDNSKCKIIIKEEIKDDICKCIAKMDIVVTPIDENNLSVAFFLPTDKTEPYAFGTLKKVSNSAANN